MFLALLLTLRRGAPRIHGDLLKLGMDVCQATIAKSRRARGYCAYDEQSRTHLSLTKDAPILRPIAAPDGRVVAIPQVGGLLHRYERLAA